MIDYKEHIDSDVNIMLGKPCIRGTRITVEAVLEMLGCGMSHSEIISDYPNLTEEKIRAVLIYAANHIDKGNAA